MGQTETTRLLEEAKLLLQESSLPSCEKDNLMRNIEYFMSQVKSVKHVANCKWEWFDEGEDGHGLDLIWDWPDVKGRFGFYADNGHGFGFKFGEHSEGCYVGGEGGEYGFSCGLFLDDLEGTLTHMGY